MSILTAFGLRQFSSFLPSSTHPGAHNLTVSHLTPFGARLDIEVITTPHPLNANRQYEEGDMNTYVHFMLNQRTIPLGVSFEECDLDRLDGWCELSIFLTVVKGEIAKAEYDYACNGDWDAVAYGEVMDGAPPLKK